ncbi:MAG: threonine synthase [Alphaproteobacteria bacterium]|nr:MAG: threonine synthase [Alphaproteobacteria bacterium]
MRYTSTRREIACGFREVIASGLAPGGGLYLPHHWPRLDAEALARLATRTYVEALMTVGALFSAEDCDAELWRRVAEGAVRAFRHPAVAPLAEFGPRQWLLELFHGPTLSFKDYGLQPLGRLLDELATAEGRPLFILGATSGDTGSAGIAAFRGRANARIIILHPAGRVSEVQRRQMTTETAENVLNIAIEGSFDDCQRLAKELLAERAAANRETVLSVNSINWGRLLFQTAYHVFIAARLSRHGRRLALAIPSGNFGNALAAIIAARIGAPIAHLIVASNANDALARVLATGVLEAQEPRTTLSPAMDIQVPSNLERLLFMATGADAAATAECMTGLRERGRLALPADWRERLPLTIEAHAISDEETLATMRETYRRTDRIVDPHTAVALAAAGRSGIADEHELVVVSTAHPAKFPDAVRKAIGIAPPVPAPFADLFAREERCARCAPDLAAVRHLIDCSSPAQ